MTLPLSGALSMQAINAEFGRGLNLNAYRGTTWYTDAGASGTFSSGAISMSEFYGKRLTAPMSYVAGASNQNTTTLAIPAHVAGDLLLMGAARATNGTITVPAGWTLVATQANTGRYTIAFRIATAPGTTSGTWTGTNGLMVNIYRGASGIGNASITWSSSGSTITWPARTLQVTNGSSWVAGIGYAGSTASGLTTPTGRTSRRGANFQSCWDTNGGVASYASQTSTITSQAKYVATVEIKAA